MKKTLIALVALSGAALATELKDATLDTTDSAITLSSTSALYSATAVSYVLQLDIDTLKADLFNSGVKKVNYNLGALKARTSSTTDAYIIGASIIFTTSGSSDTTSSIWTTTNQTQGRTNLMANYSTTMLSNVDLTGYTGAAFALTHDQSSTIMTLTLAKADGSTTVYTNTDGGLHWSKEAGISSMTFGTDTDLVQRAYVFNSKLSTDDTTRLSTLVATAPEPATATLSLLALAGLAARRRRLR